METESLEDRHMRMRLKDGVISSAFWVRTPTGLILRNSITPDEFMYVTQIDYEHRDGSKSIMQIKSKEIQK